MKNFILITMAVLTSVPMLAQDDDLYYVPKKDSAVKTARQTYYCGSDRDVDEYNRRGCYRHDFTEVNDSDIIAFDGQEGVFPDSMECKGGCSRYNDSDCADYTYSRELNRWYGYYDPWLYGRGYFGPWSYGYGWYSPYYYSWYDPWYYSYYGGWYGYYDPWFYGYYGGWYRPWHYDYPGWAGGGHHHGGDWARGGVGAGYSNRGSVNTGNSGMIAGAGNRRTGGNVYNNIAKKSQAQSRVVSSRRSVGSLQNYNDRTSTRTYTPNYNNSNAGSFSGGSRSGGGGFGGGSRGGGGFSGGGGHGGRR